MTKFTQIRRADIYIISLLSNEGESRVSIHLFVSSYPNHTTFAFVFLGSVYPSQSMTDSQLYQGYDYSSTCSSEQVPSNQQDYVYDYSTQSCQPSPSSYRQTKTGKTSVTSVTSKYAGVLTPRRRPGRPRIKSEPTEEEKRVRLEKKSMCS